MPPVLSQPTKIFEISESSKSLLDSSCLNQPESKGYNVKQENVLLGTANAQLNIVHRSQALKIYNEVIENAEKSIDSSGCLNALRHKSYALCKIGDICASQSKYKKAVNNYERAIECCNRIFLETPKDNFSTTIKSIALISKGNVQKTLGDNMAEDSYKAAIVACDEGLTKIPEKFQPVSSKRECSSGRRKAFVLKCKARKSY